MTAVTSKRIKATQRRQQAGFWFVLPAFLVYLLFFGYPFFRTVYLSFTEWNGLGDPTFVGFANYSRLIADPLMWSSLWNNLIWVFWGTVMPISIGLVLSVILWTGVKGGIVFRTIYFLPMVLSAFVIGVIWKWIYHPLYGLLNQGLKAIGLSGLATTGWLGETSTALYAVLAAAIWSYIGFCVVVLFSGLQKVDTELVDASRIDGASAWQRFKNIIIPQIRPVLTMVLVYTIIGGFNVFDVVWAMTEGGPANSSEVIATYTYEAAFRVREVGYGAALSMVMTVIALFAAWATLKLRKAD
jgi:raffinose/stachyose/melibiose transport system permease protein